MLRRALVPAIALTLAVVTAAVATPTVQKSPALDLDRVPGQSVRRDDPRRRVPRPRRSPWQHARAPESSAPAEGLVGGVSQNHSPSLRHDVAARRFRRVQAVARRRHLAASHFAVQHVRAVTRRSIGQRRRVRCRRRPPRARRCRFLAPSPRARLTPCWPVRPSNSEQASTSHGATTDGRTYRHPSSAGRRRADRRRRPTRAAGRRGRLRGGVSRRTRPPIHALCRRMTGSEREARELVQDVFVRAWEKLESVSRPEPARDLVAPPRRQRRAATSANAKRDGLRMIDDVDEATFGARSPANQHRRRHRSWTGRSRSSRPARARCSCLHDVHGYSHDEIAQMTGIAAGTARAQLWRARRALTRLLDL